ncbi:hypothetical protein EC957_008713 [Mortierella hygrophila]|uniref:Uncharacterized protein n=1 Tax=Mortierella hygrophila TaxID=979708 RepID=A0A9P6FCX6_9FUNG|nr:hypothetical protein EC957_008713 [Mortierella hygrophila]
MKSFTAILFAALAVLALASAAPLPQEDTESKVDLRNQSCKEPFQTEFVECMMNGVDATECRAPYDVGNAKCDSDHPTSSS